MNNEDIVLKLKDTKDYVTIIFWFAFIFLIEYTFKLGKIPEVVFGIDYNGYAYHPVDIIFIPLYIGLVIFIGSHIVKIFEKLIVPTMILESISYTNLKLSFNNERGGTFANVLSWAFAYYVFKNKNLTP